MALRQKNRYNFENFIVSGCNENAYKACIDMAEDINGGFIALYGPSSCGKTHLLNAIERKFTDEFPHKRVCSTTLENLVAKYIRAVKTETQAEYRQMICGYDLLIVDNMQFVAGKKALQKELTSWFCEMIDSGKFVAIAFDRPAEYYEDILGNVSRRYSEKCRIVEMYEADTKLREEYVNRLLGKGSINLSADVMDFLVYSRCVPFCALKGQLTKLELHQKQKGKPLSEEEMIKYLDIFR